MPPRERIAIIGAGHVGATTAYALMLRALVREIVLIDSDTALDPVPSSHEPATLTNKPVGKPLAPPTVGF